jgi:hypothetical protein
MHVSEGSAADKALPKAGILPGGRADIITLRLELL